MKKRISKNIFQFSHLIIELKKEKRKKTVFESILIQNQFQKTKIKIFKFIFWFQIKKWISKSSFIFQFWLWNWKMKNEKFSKFVLFLNQKTNYTFGTRIVHEVRFSLLIFKLKNEWPFGYTHFPHCLKKIQRDHFFFDKLKYEIRNKALIFVSIQ